MKKPTWKIDDDFFTSSLSNISSQRCKTRMSRVDGSVGEEKAPRRPGIRGWFRWRVSEVWRPQPGIKFFKMIKPDYLVLTLYTK